MMIRILAATAAFATLSVAAQAGTLSGSTWTPSSACVDPGPAPIMDGKNGDTYNKSAKEYEAWKNKAIPYQVCVQNEAKADNSAVVESANKILGTINDGSKAFSDAANDAMEKLKAKKK